MIAGANWAACRRGFVFDAKAGCQFRTQSLLFLIKIYDQYI